MGGFQSLCRLSRESRSQLNSIVKKKSGLFPSPWEIPVGAQSKVDEDIKVFFNTQLTAARLTRKTFILSHVDYTESCDTFMVNQFQILIIKMLCTTTPLIKTHRN